MAGRYALLNTVGSGASGQLWRGHDASLDRIVAVEPLEERFNERDDPPTAWFEDATGRLTLVVRPAARWIAEDYPTLEVADEGRWLRVTFPVASLDWAARLVLRLGADVVEVRDDAVRDASRALAREALRAYP